MDRKARRALLTIRACVGTGRYRVLAHVTERMDQRGLVWADVLAVLDTPAKVADDGTDRFGRPKWIIGGKAADGERVELVCALDEDAAGRFTVFITLY
jgi:hypothetical protein